MTLRLTIKTANIFVYGQSVEAGVRNRLNKHYTSNSNRHNM